MPKEFLVFLIAASPIAEMRGAIPAGLFAYHLPAAETFIWSVLGNMVPFFLIYGLGDLWLALMEKRKGIFQRLTDWVLHHSRRKFNDRYIRYGSIILPVFVAIPLPLFGIWTGALGAFIVGIPFKKALPLVALGVLAGAIVIFLAVTGSAAALPIFIHNLE